MDIQSFFIPHQTQVSSIVENAEGNSVLGWSDGPVVMGKLRQLSNSERFASGGEVAVSTHRFYCEISDLTEVDAVVYEGRRYKFSGHPNNVMNMDEFLQIDCELIGSV